MIWNERHYLLSRAVADRESDDFRWMAITGAEMQEVGVPRHNHQLARSGVFPYIEIFGFRQAEVLDMERVREDILKI